MIKKLEFLGDSAKRLRAFNKDVRQELGHQLEKVQHGEQPDDFKPMSSIGRGVEEIRMRDETGIYRVVYTARLKDMIYVLHAFQKKTETTSKLDTELAKTRYLKLMRSL